ncbi:hypothetical protein NDU88_001571 [Pleurodeles waltl]|uniref:Uncharacterized protein n=1 Tax=Pleurodeles waltl TaxID=8319 RepID=A0AAV7VA32_PLEWA|nr:hypothetical protein NDU88_001571 [Pleurodeles waltl]
MAGVLWTPPSSARKAKPYRTRNDNQRDPPVGLWVLRDPRRKRRKKSDIGKCPGEDWIRRRERSEVGAGPQGGELSCDRGLGLSESGPHDELGAATRALRGGAPATRCRAAPGPGTGEAVQRAASCRRVTSVTGPGGAEDRWTRGWAQRLDRAPGAGLGRRRGAREDSAGPGGAGQSLCPWGPRLKVGEQACRGGHACRGLLLGLKPPQVTPELGAGPGW